MGSGTHYATITTTASKSCRGGDDDGSQERNTTDKRTEDVISVTSQQIDIQNHVGHCSLHRTPTHYSSSTRCREWLIASLVLIILHCDLVRAVQYAVVEAVSGGEEVGQQKIPESPVEHIRDVYRERGSSSNQGELQMDEDEMQRIQDLVLRGLNITRIPRASEVSDQLGEVRVTTPGVLNRFQAIHLWSIKLGISGFAIIILFTSNSIEWL